MINRFLIAAVVVWSGIVSLQAQTPEWIWHDDRGAQPGEGEVRFFRKVFEVDGTVASARLIFAADNHAVVFLNGKKVGQNDDWQAPVRLDVAKGLVKGRNTLAVRAWNDGGPAGLMVRLEYTVGDKKRALISDRSWESTAVGPEGWERPDYAGKWFRPVSLGKLGVAPWGDVIAGRPASGGGGPREATAAETLTTLPGFEVELLRSAAPEEGSWICMTLDGKGRLVISPQGNRQPLLRVTLTAEGKVDRIEPIELPLWEAMGLLWAFDSLYVNGRGPDGTGLYRVRDTDGDDRLDEARFLKTMHGGGEHGPHGLALGPDNMIYLVNGNHTRIPVGVTERSAHFDYAEDHLLPRQWDGNGHARGIMAPGGYVARTDPEGREWELLLAGFRNAYDIAFNEDGEMFTYDSDMEWDWGMPWYRPTRINHCVSGAEFGWRSGTGKWPGYYSDSLPATVNIGIGSPTGVTFGAGSHFPPKYQRAFYAMDWTYGRILAVHLTPRGASYDATFEAFVRGRPLNVSDMTVGKDGALYFVTGGRGTQSGLYRVSYSGPNAAVEDRKENVAAREARALRRRLEALHGKKDPGAVDFAWPHLRSEDRWIRYAARIAVESQPVETWQERALAETTVRGALTALLALARKGSAEMQDPLLESLRQFWPGRLSEPEQLEAVRIASLSFIRMGRPDPSTVEDLIGEAEPLYPTPSDRLNRELCQALIYLEAPSVVGKTLDLIDRASTQEERMFYIFHLRTAGSGWTMEDRRRYFSWLNRAKEKGGHDPELLRWFKDAGRGYGNGASFNKFIENFRKEAGEHLSETERQALAEYISGESQVPRPEPVPRSVVREWKLADFEDVLEKPFRGRSYRRGAEAFASLQCGVCHRFGDEGGAVGQDLTAVSSRYTHRDILDSILNPSKVVSDQYMNTTYHLKDGEEVTGRVVDESGGKLVVLVNPLTDFKVEVVAGEVARREASKLSPMPEGLVNVLTKEEILDLVAFLESGGRTDHPAFRE